MSAPGTPDPAAAALAEIRAIEQVATKGPWIVYGIGDDEVRSEAPWGLVAETMGNAADARFIAAARTALPRLLAAVEAALALHEESRSGCTSCTDAYGDPVEWPCEEFTAITTTLAGKEAGDEQ